MTTQWIRPALAAALVAVLLAGGATAEAGVRTTQLQRDVDALHDLGVTGVLARLEGPHSVAVARSGVANLDTSRPVPPDPYLRIGSITKTFVAVVALQLVGEGRLSLSDPVEHWLPGVVAGNGNDGRAITVRQLLQHTSGLYDYSNELIPQVGLTAEMYRRERWRVSTPEELVAIAMSHPPTGPGFAYSNTNYVLAGMLIEAVTGRGWDREVHDRIIGPLRLRRTSTPGTWPFLPAPHATNYHQFGPDEPLVDTTIAVRALDSGADGSMIGTASELNRFFEALIDGRLLAPAQLAEMQQVVSQPDGTGAGLGLSYTPLTCGGGYWGHGGTGLGYHVEAAVTDDGGRRLTTSLFTNAFVRDVAEARHAALYELVDRALCG